MSFSAPVEALAASLLLVLGPLVLTWSIGFATPIVRYIVSSAFVELAERSIPALRGARPNDARAGDAQPGMELRGSLLAGAIFALQFLPVALPIRAGWTQLYFDGGARVNFALYFSFWDRLLGTRVEPRGLRKELGMSP